MKAPILPGAVIFGGEVLWSATILGGAALQRRDAMPNMTAASGAEGAR